MSAAPGHADAGVSRSAPSIVLAGGGSAGHVNPLLATADALRRLNPDAVITVLGTEQGLERDLVPQRGYPLRTIPKVPFPRRPNRAAIAFPTALRRAIKATAAVLDEVGADVVVGFGGYVAAPAYLTARSSGRPIVIHEQNARPGMANRLGARFAAAVAITFGSTPLKGSEVVGLPLRREISTLDRQAARPEAAEAFGLEADRRTLLVFGGSLGAQRLNEAFAAAADDLIAADLQVLHITGAGKHLEVSAAARESGRYVAREYTDRMDLAYAIADLAVCRAGAGTVCELTACGIPAIYVPLPIGNGEQRLNAADVVHAGGGLLVEDGKVTDDWVRSEVIPLVADDAALQAMADRAVLAGHQDADERLARTILQVAGSPAAGDSGERDPDEATGSDD